MEGLPRRVPPGKSGNSGKSGYSGSEIPENPGMPDRKYREFRKIRSFRMVPARFFYEFPSFFEVIARKRLDSLHEGPNLCFYCHARYETRFADFAKISKIGKIQWKIASTMLRARVERKKLDVSASGDDSTSILADFGVLEVPPGIPGHPSRLLGAASGAPGALPGRFGVTSRASRGGFPMLPRRS